MKVGIIISFWPTHDPDSGIGNNYHRLACSLAERGHEVTVFHINPQKPFWQRGDSHRESGFEVIEIPCRVLPDKNWIGWFPASHLAAAIRLNLLLRNRVRDLDVMETTSYGGFAQCYYQTKRLWRNVPPILIRISTTGEQLRDYNDDKAQGRYSTRLENALIRHAPYRCTHTEANREMICANMDLDPAGIEVIPHGIDLPNLSAIEQTKGNHVLYVGRFELRKGTDTLLKAIPQVLAAQPDCVFYLVGGGIKGEAWRQAFIEQHGDLADRVHLPGRLPLAGLDELYRTCDFLVAPSLYESFGMTNLEAMRYGKPIIGCLASGGSAEVIGDGGLLVPPGNVTALAKAILRLRTDRDLHSDLSARARLRAEFYSMEKNGAHRKSLRPLHPPPRRPLICRNLSTVTLIYYPRCYLHQAPPRASAGRLAIRFFKWKHLHVLGGLFPGIRCDHPTSCFA